MKSIRVYSFCLLISLGLSSLLMGQKPSISSIDSDVLCQQIDSLYILGQSKVTEDNQKPLLSYCNKAISVGSSIPDNPCLAKVYLAKGKALLADFGPRDLATRSLLKGLQLYTLSNDTTGIANSNLQLGVVSFDMEQYQTAINYFIHVLDITPKDSMLYAVSEYLLALSYSELGAFSLAEEKFAGAVIRYGALHAVNAFRVEIFKGRLLINQNKPKKALFYLNAIKIPKNDPQFFASELIPYHCYLAKANLLIGDYKEAIRYGSLCYQAARNNGSSVIYLRESDLVLNRSYLALNQYDSAYFYLNALNEINDTVASNKVAQRVAQLRGQYEFDSQMLEVQNQRRVENAENEVEAQTQRIIKNVWLGAFLIALFLAILIFNHRNRINREKQRSDKLLLNILPASIAEELKEHGRAEAQQFESVSILFSDFKSFTANSAKMTAQELVKEIDIYFKAFDGIMDKYEIEKIKTIGDAYMAAGGIPKPSIYSVKRTILAGLDMQRFVSQIESEKRAKGELAFEMRVGVHTGPVVAGIVGDKKFQYDLWGDSVNTASRMESCGEVNKVNISHGTYLLVHNEPDLIFEDRGLIEAKGKGEVRMWFVGLAISAILDSARIPPLDDRGVSREN